MPVLVTFVRLRSRTNTPNHTWDTELRVGHKTIRGHTYPMNPNGTDVVSRVHMHSHVNMHGHLARRSPDTATPWLNISSRLTDRKPA
jgi:hypothetical protein